MGAMTDLEVRRLAAEDLPAAAELGRLAFGGDPDSRHALSMDDRLLRWGGFDDRGRLVAKATDLFHQQWWGGRTMATCGVAGVAVEPEHRGRGAARAVLTALLHDARERGALTAALFCTSTAVYRSLGFEVCGVLRDTDLPTASLPRARVPGITLRAGDPTDWAAVRDVYDAVAGSGNGLLTRDRHPAGLDGVTLAVDSTGTTLGYASWRRGRGYDDASVLTVVDLLAVSPDAAQALVTTLASWQTVVSTVRFRPLPWVDAVAAQLPGERLREHHPMPWMHRPLDVAGAVAARGWSTAVRGEVALRLVDPLIAANDGCWRL